MRPNIYLHEHPQFEGLIRLLASEKNLPPALIEKDYWVMHCLYGLAKAGLTFELKGGTSLSKGYNLLGRFSEDIDIHIDPSCAPFKVASNPKQVKKTAHLNSRKAFYDGLASELAIDGITEIIRDTEFDDGNERFTHQQIRSAAGYGHSSRIYGGGLAVLAANCGLGLV